MKALFIASLSCAVLLSSCTTPSKTKAEQSDLVSITLDDVSLLDAIRMSVRIGRGPHFTADSLSKTELENIRVSVNVKDVTRQDYMKHIASATGLTIEYVSETHQFRVKRATQKDLRTTP